MRQITSIMCLIFILLNPGMALGSDVIRVLMIGQVFPYETPVAGWFESDPAFDFVVVPVRRDTGGWINFPEKEAKRYVRLYFPRNFESLVGYDFLCYVDTYFGHLTGNQIDRYVQGHQGLGAGRPYHPRRWHVLGGGLQGVLTSTRIGTSVAYQVINLSKAMAGSCLAESKSFSEAYAEVFRYFVDNETPPSLILPPFHLGRILNPWHRIR